jgi:hypothetical protein
MWKIIVTKQDVPELPPKAAQLLICFLNISDGSLAHPNDSKRFYGFIRHCHARRVKLSADSFKVILNRVGCSKYQSDVLAEIYKHGRNLLKVPCPI